MHTRTHARYTRYTRYAQTHARTLLGRTEGAVFVLALLSTAALARS
jgi:hypothetical protein